MKRNEDARSRSAVALLAALVAGCTLDGSEGSDTIGGGPVPRCGSCVGEDGGESAPPAVNGQTVAELKTIAGAFAIDEFLLRSTLPVPRGTYPRSDGQDRSEEHTSELQSQSNLVCRLLLEQKKSASPCWPRNRTST